MTKGLQGSLLISHPRLNSADTFSQSVILLYKHDADGSAGLILNQPTQYNFQDICGEKGIHSNIDCEVRYGGPVGVTQCTLLHTSEWQSSSTRVLDNQLAISSDDGMLERLANGDEPAYWRIFVGYCGWAPGQLDDEMQGEPPYRPEHAWLVSDYSDELAFLEDEKSQWRAGLDSAASRVLDPYFA